MRIKAVGLNELVDLSVSIIDTDEYEIEWNNYTVQVRAQFTIEHFFVDEYTFIDEEGFIVRGIRTTNPTFGSYAYGPAADLIKRFVLRTCTTQIL